MKHIVLVTAFLLLPLGLSPVRADGCTVCAKAVHVPIHFPIPYLQIPVPHFGFYCEKPSCSWGQSKNWYNYYPPTHESPYGISHSNPCISGVPGGYGGYSSTQVPAYWYGR